MAIDITGAISAIGEERFRELAGPASRYAAGSVTGRAASTAALGALADELRASDASLAGARGSDIKAAILREAAGVDVSGRTVERDEACARAILGGLAPCWREEADSGSLPRGDVLALAALPEPAQSRLKNAACAGRLGKRATSGLIKRAREAAGLRGARTLLSAVELLEEAASSGAAQPEQLVMRARAAVEALEELSERRGSQ